MGVGVGAAGGRARAGPGGREGPALRGRGRDLGLNAPAAPSATAPRTTGQARGRRCTTAGARGRPRRGRQPAASSTLHAPGASALRRAIDFTQSGSLFSRELDSS